ncbi:MAG: bifunctional diaminohydroxyphosphoribosylaminopyrimidine deaminase/5-amino-6-(5-phosphoribosylamino)uracil reductase RibD [Rhodospirillaceae bacterium]|nr:bifunctional diaminohydroxyphosphoribosylaminopyrimidine deaminase/5-amino-6-(5-phosphoribosylamino)uracil reductase RibD [Rhodospirillaceae bacterium]
MSVALALGRRGLGTTAPNPSVGCVLVKEGRVVGRGWTQPGGRPHAEAEALGRAGAEARGATAYVTLEPCAHHGRTPPCAEALIGAGVARVVTALEDPDSRVAGSGLARLAAAGIAVESGVCADIAACDLGGYLRRQRAGRPRFSLKLATSLDGRIATAGGDSRWITGTLARARGHALRASHDAVMIGIGTALADDPMLTCRLPGVRRQTLRIVLDSQARLPADSRLAQTAAEHPVWQFPSAGVGALGLDRVADAGGWRLRSRNPCGGDLLETWHREREAGGSPAQ